jgi:hypothetical protein
VTVSPTKSSPVGAVSDQANSDSPAHHNAVNAVASTRLRPRERPSQPTDSRIASSPNASDASA